MPKNLKAGTFEWFQAVLPSQTQLHLCIFRKKYGYQIEHAMKKINPVLNWTKCSKCFILHTYKFLDMLITMTQVLRLYIQMFLTYVLYVCSILETAPHRTTFRIFCNIIQKTKPEENSHKMFLISSPIVHFLMRRSRTFGGIRIKFHLERAKGMGKREYGRRGPKWRGFFAKFPLLSKIKLYRTNCWSDKLLTPPLQSAHLKT